MPKDLSAARGAQLVEAVGEARAVLDVGGVLEAGARALGERGCAVTTIRTDGRSVAASDAPLVRRLDAGSPDLLAALEEGEVFDVVLLGDELSRVADAAGLVRQALEHVRPDGRLVLAAPHVAHGSVRLALLAGRWEPAAPGRLFSRASLVKLVQEAGLEVVEIRAVAADALVAPIGLPDADLPSATVQWVRSQPEASHHAYVLSARRPPAGGVPRQDVPAVRVDEVLEPVQDHHAAAVAGAEAEALELRHRLLTQRDHIIGLEAVAGRATAELRRERREAEAEISEIRATTTWRAGRLAVAPVAAVRRLLGGRP